MRKHVLSLTTTVAVLTCGAIAASAQGSGTQPTPGGPMMQQQGQDDYHRHGGGMMGGGGGGMMGRGMMGQGCDRGARAHIQGNGCRPRWHRYPGGNAGFHARALAGRSSPTASGTPSGGGMKMQGSGGGMMQMQKH